MCLLQVNPSSPKQVTTLDSVYISSYQTYVTGPLTTRKQTKLERAIGTSLPTAVADIIAKECPFDMVMKRNILNKSKACSDTVCKQLSGSSVLYNPNQKQFETMKGFCINKVWQEMKATQPFFIDFMNALTKNQVDIDKTKEEAKVE